MSQIPEKSLFPIYQNISSLLGAFLAFLSIKFNFADRKKQRKMRLYSKKLNMASNKLTQFVILIAVENSNFLYADFYICN
jgi:hypothetical protein